MSNVQCIWTFINNKVIIIIIINDKTIILGSSIMLNKKEKQQVWLIIVITNMFIYNMHIKQNDPTIKSLKLYFEYFNKQEQYIVR